jgi:extracellular elastinolytic metalloproteinase
MYLWDTATPLRDAAMDSDILIHELTHGLSNRLTGGPANSDCLGSGEAGGMGEGWSDTLAWAFTMKSSDNRHLVRPAAVYAMNDKRGIRKYRNIIILLLYLHCILY